MKLSFNEVFAPIIPQLATEEVKNLTKDSVFTIDDLTYMRKCYTQLQQEQRAGNARPEIRIRHLRTLVESKKK
jgi:hypothetical protein